MTSSAQTTPATTKFYTTPCQTFAVDQFFEFEESPQTTYHTYSEKTLLYCSPDENSEVIDTIGFNYQLVTTDLIQRYKQDTIFSTEVATGKKTAVNVFLNETGTWLLTSIDKKTGYIKKNDLANYVSTNPNFLAGFVGKNPDRQIELRSFDDSRPHAVLSIYLCKQFFHEFEIQNQYFNGLNTPGSVVRFTTFTQSCPSATYNEFIVFDKGKFTFITADMASGEGNQYDAETVYFPLQFSNGKVLLVAHGDWEHIFNYDNATLNTFDYPKNIGVPIENLIVITKEHTEEVLDANGEPIMEDEYDYKVKVVKSKPKYYRWDGKSLVKVSLKK
ncbi:MAG: hypothetical protein ACKVOK_15970 [Flavobacteriales bacterium]